MLGNTGTYANKKRKKPVLKQKKISDGNEVVKSNPSKRHRDRLNGELDRLTDLLPFPEDVRSRLDKLSVLRLSVGYLRVKSYFKATMKNGSSGLTSPGLNGQNRNKMEVAGFTEGDILLQALNGFVMLVTSEGLVFYASPTIKDYLGFDQSDVVHQSVFELIHTDDRDLFRQQLHFALNPPSLPAGVDVLQGCGSTVMYNPEHLPPENSSFLERSFVCRFRCLLDNSSGFLALKFQGRLKYLHGQNILRGNRDKPQLGLFAIAIPVQPPSIVEIRAKMLLFQTKHKLDFTPTGIDSRGKIILGYTETELCMKGSGYQFIHAADMMHCADKHIRMIKTGESGLTVFRLLSKSNGWVWVKSNAKLIYKAGRPEFIIAYQKAIINAEGEEHLHQRRLQLPFGFATGEAILYDTGPTVDITLFQFNKQFNTSNMSENVTPGSLLDCFIRQDEAVYTERVEPPLPVDRVFMESHALVSVPSDSWAENGSGTTTGNCVVKEEAKKSVMSVIDNLEKVAQSGDFSEVLQTLDVSDAELVEWENALSRMGQDEGQQSDVSSELDSVLANDIFDYLESVLFQESGGGCVNARRPDPPELFPPAACFSDLQLCESDLFKTQSPGHPYSPKNGLTGQSFNDSAQIFNGTQKLSHQGPLIAQPDTNMPSLQELQLQDIFSPSIELPELVVPDAFVEDSPAPFQSCGQVSVSHVGYPQGISGHTQCPGNHMQSPAMAANGQMLQSCGKPLNDVAPGVMDILPPLIPCNDFISSTTPNIHVPIASARLQGAPPFETHKVKQQKLHHTGVTLSGHEPMPACNGQTSESQTFPPNGLWPRSGCRLSHSQQGGLACGQAAAQNGCAYDQHFSSSPAVGDVLTLSGSSVQMESPLQGSCFFQWSHGEPETVTSAVNQQNGNIMSPSQHALHIPHYQEPLRHRTQDERPSAQLCGIVAPPSALGGHRPG